MMEAKVENPANAENLKNNALVAELVEALQRMASIPQGKSLWSIDAIAMYCGKSSSLVQQRIVCKPDFPKRIKEDPRAQPRWVSGEVINWFESKRSN